MVFIDLVIFILVCFGLTQILVYGKILDFIRPKHYLFNCTMCMGFWVGLFVWVVSPLGGLFLIDDSIVTGFLLGCLSSGTSYLLGSIVDDGGIKFSGR